MSVWEWDAVGAWVLSCCYVGVVLSVLLAGDIFALIFPHPSLLPAKAFCIPGLGWAGLWGHPLIPAAGGSVSQEIAES